LRICRCVISAARWRDEKWLRRGAGRGSRACPGIDVGEREVAALSRRAILPASILSFLALAPWMSFMYRAWPITKGMFSAAQRSATQYQANMHSAARTTSARKGARAWSRGSGLAGRFLSQTVLPSAVENAEVQRSCVQVDAGVELVLFHVASHRGLRVRELRWSLGYFQCTCAEEAMMSIQTLQLTGAVVGACCASLNNVPRRLSVVLCRKESSQSEGPDTDRTERIGVGSQ